MDCLTGWANRLASDGSEFYRSGCAISKNAIAAAETLILPDCLDARVGNFPMNLGFVKHFLVRDASQDYDDLFKPFNCAKSVQEFIVQHSSVNTDRLKTRQLCQNF